MDGGSNDWLIMGAAEELRSWGYTESKPLILKSDSESSLLAVRNALSGYLGGEVIPEPTSGRVCLSF